MLAGEVWLPIPGFYGYEVSNLGRVKSLRRKIPLENNNHRIVQERILKPGSSSSGHLSVVLTGYRTKQVHSLVLLAFVGERPFGHDILHLDHNPKNNSLSNIRYGTRSENLCMDYDVGSRSRAVRVVAQELDGTRREFKTVTEASEFYNLTQPAVSYLLKSGGRSRYQLVRFFRVES